MYEFLCELGELVFAASVSEAHEIINSVDSSEVDSSIKEWERWMKCALVFYHGNEVQFVSSPLAA